MDEYGVVLKEIEVGEFGDGLPWKIVKNTVHTHKYSTKCKHCVDIGDYGYFRANEKEPCFVTPLVVKAYNEAGHCSTEVCAECIMEALMGYRGLLSARMAAKEDVHE